MTATTISDIELLRTRMAGAIGRRMPGAIERLGWSAGQLAAFQRDRLGALLAHAIECSPFHAERLRGIDPSRFELADLPRLGEYLCLVSGGSSGLRGLFVQTVEAYAEFAASLMRRAMAVAMTSGGPPPDGLVLGEYLCLVSGGSSGSTPADWPPPRPPGRRYA
jgi:phenylacetate-CoA ligase